MAQRRSKPPITALALKAARLRTGYRSVIDAAIAIGVSENTLRAHESGKRKITKDQASIYSRAFHIETDTLLGEFDDRLNWQLKDEIEDLYRAAKRGPQDGRAGQWARLRFARVMRGFATLSEAARRFGVSRGTAGSHENGDNQLSNDVVRAYASAYGMNAAWLDSGDGPSGLGAQVDQRIKGVPAHALPDLADKLGPAPAASRSPGEWASVKQKFIDATAGSSFGGKVHEIQFDADGSEKVLKPRQTWIIPLNARMMLRKRGVKEIVAVTLLTASANFNVGDLLFVDTTQRDPNAGGLFIYQNKDNTTLFEHLAGAKPSSRLGGRLGKVVAVFRFI
jgi:transcriptional regulator with XRE-family HTH domain